MPIGPVHDAHVVLPCPDLAATLPFFLEDLGMRVVTIWPADHPRYAVVAGHGVRLALDPGVAGAPGLVRLRCGDPDAVAGGRRTLTAPNGTTIELVDADPPVVIPPLRTGLVVSRAADSGEAGAGRAGMRYRDLIPDRHGGRFIASHIAIPEGGPVPDYVHFHKVRFQMIYCRTGWVKVVYEDQGEPFVLHAGDCVLQPPRIRHRVLEASAGLEVVEVACPAEHETHADADLPLPNGHCDPARDFDGQRFVRHVAADATWTPWRLDGFEARELGISAATAGLAGVRVARRIGDAPCADWSHEGELLFLFVLDGSVVVRAAGHGDERLVAGDSVSVPPGLVHSLADASDELALLEVTLPA
jgi:quercetin dioxygenase-like cupin family protein